MRILFLSHSPDDENGGASRIYHMLTAELRARGHSVDLFHMESMGLPQNRRAQLAAQRLAMPSYLSRFGARQVEGKNYDVVMSSSGMAAPLFAQLRSKANRPLLVNHLHGLTVYDHLAAVTQEILGYSLRRRLYKRLSGPLQCRWDDRGIQTGDLTIVQNLRDLAWIRDHRLSGHALTMIPAAVHPSLIEASKGARIDRDGTIELLWFASWEPRKGAQYLPGAFRQIRSRYPDVRLTIGGTGMKPAQLLPEFAPEDRKSIGVLGRVSVAEQAVLFKRATIFLFPSLSEGFGLALAEAMCFGMPAVSGATGFASDFLQNGRDVMIAPPSSEHIARAVIALLGDSAERARIAANGEEVARTFDLARMADSYEAGFAEALADLRSTR
ncbi:glycosyltransferase family 4 protein [Sphingomonas sp. PP-CC-3A-396]|uniref:glycosyltransferase family 4 protein n=1 Tax=Sphingomonas sp. PP-CC-3A-396 TaxID=2135655 RepID=UPI0010494E94|nr:glycosyltransferase family 4 protein [Sphingomonas sp. PP-CC-3A-396]TCQ03022.1 glycosyltransferase involved in cell wall biosynthesis [Sphingomonas sp. PP-CC-3A-396]